MIKFICDEQLGKLARWLKVIGQDVYYKNRLEDYNLMRIAEEESRIILTRDTRLLKKLDEKGIAYFFVSENYPALQLKELVEHFKESIRIRIFTRCTDCNVLLEEVSPEEVKEMVPPFVFRTQKVFRRCPGCGKVFWRGTHRPQVDIQLRSVLGELYDKLKDDVWSNGK